MTNTDTSKRPWWFRAGHIISQNRNVIAYLIGALIVVTSLYYSKQGADNSHTSNTVNTVSGCRSTFNLEIVARANNNLADATGQVAAVSLEQQNLITTALKDLQTNDKADLPGLLLQTDSLARQTTTVLANEDQARQGVKKAQQSYNLKIIESEKDPHKFIDECLALQRATGSS